MDLDHDRAAAEGTTRRRMLGGAGALAVTGAMVPLTGTGIAAAGVSGHPEATQRPPQRQRPPLAPGVS